MILQKLASAIRRQDWFQVIIEVLIVVVGIFIGLQVDDWNQQRLDNQEEQAFLFRVHEELQESINNRGFIRDQQIEDWNIVSTIGFSIFEDTRPDHLTSRECQAIARSSILLGNITQLPSFSALQSTGRLHIIRDEELRMTFIKFEQLREAIEKFAGDRVIDLGAKYPDLLHFTPTREANGNIEATVTCEIQTILQNQGFVNDFIWNMDMLEAYMTSGLFPIINNSNLLHELIDKNLNISH